MADFPTESEISASWRPGAPILASICCVTYNHRHFIADAIEGFLVQRTTFPFEIVIADDCSPDGTRDVIEAYRARYPALIKIVGGHRNIGMNRNNACVRQHATGKYIAHCDGDDYWTDSAKLQQQVDFLEANPDYAVCYGASIAHDDAGRRVDFPHGLERDTTAGELIRGCALNAHTVCFRNVLGEMPPEYFAARTSDVFLWSLLGWHGKGRFLAGIAPSVYRVHAGGIYSQRDESRRAVMSLTTYAALLAYYDRIGEDETAAHFAERVRRIALSTLWSRDGLRWLTRRLHDKTRRRLGGPR
jgi:glycosyltransferase involved in cell wall biosynthesis